MQGCVVADSAEMAHKTQNMSKVPWKQLRPEEKRQYTRLRTQAHARAHTDQN